MADTKPQCATIPASAGMNQTTTLCRSLDDYKEKISRLYQTHPLSEVIEIMAKEEGFRAR
jgi:hypothetical protein